jgi:hypothetical protein
MVSDWEKAKKLDTTGRFDGGWLEKLLGTGTGPGVPEVNNELDPEFQNALEKDRTVNPHLALMSDHLWWLALAAKIGLVMMVLGILAALTSLA